MIHLDERLQAICRFVRPGSRIADIGTDHGYLLAKLLLDETAVFGYGTDIHKKPLEKAKETIAAHGLSEKVALLCTDGLQGIAPDQVDDVVIAGMGADTILHILDAAGWNDSHHRFVLQPMSKLPFLRIQLRQRGYEILAEKAVFVKHFTYTILQVRYTGTPQQTSPLFAWTGKIPKTDPENAVLYIKKQLQTVQQVQESLEKSNTNSIKQKEYNEIAEQLQKELQKQTGKR